MRKIALLTALLMLLACLAACDKTPAQESQSTDTQSQEATVESTANEETTSKKPAETTPETPQDKWSNRY